MIKVMIVDDQVLLRNSLKEIASVDEEIEVVALAGNGNEAIEICNKYEPDVVIMDIEMPELDGLTALQYIKEKCKETKIIVLTTFDSKENIAKAFVRDADGYITKEVTPEELVLSIKCVHSGLTVISSSVKRMMVEKFSKIPMINTSKDSDLSAAEIRIVQMIVDGKSNKEIAEVFNYSEGTIKNKITKIYEKLGVGDRIQLAVHVLDSDILE